MPKASGSRAHTTKSAATANGGTVALPKHRKPRRVYKESVNKNRFGCYGHTVTGPDRYYFWGSFLMIVVPGIAFLAAVVPNLIKHLHLGWIVIIPHCLLLALILSSFFMTAFSDPGIIPRHTPESPSNPFDAPPAAQRSITINDNHVSTTFSRKYCDTCQIYRPVRAIHCGVCDNCVDQFDHHCPWVGNCIGKRNYRLFLVFIFSIMIGLLYIEAFCTVDLVKRHFDRPPADRNFGKVLKNPASLILIVYCLAVQGLVGTLAVYHSYLITRGVTTNESIKGIFKKDNPYDEGCCTNWMVAWCRPIQPRYIKWQDLVPPQDLRDIPSSDSVV